ncbi:MAG: adenosylcobinamide-GDP ribazoletransferase [Chlorobiaceae bacterium]
MLSAFVTALRTLTCFSVPGKDTETFSNSLFWFPVVGFLLGLLQAAIGYSSCFLKWNELSAALVVFGGIAMTRGMHVDGLADFGDGFWGGRTRDAVLKIMKDPNVGSFGAIAVSAAMLLKWIAVLKLIEYGAFMFIVAGVVLARLVQVFLASAFSYARSEGGTARSFVSGAGWWHSIAASVLMLCILFPFFRQNLNALFVVVIAALAAALMIGLLSYRKIGGVTGDVIGAGSELTEVFVWIAGALFFVMKAKI